MGMDMTHSYVAYKRDGEWKMVPVYHQWDDGSVDYVDSFVGRYTDFFDWLQGNGNDLGDGNMSYANRGIPNRAPDEVPSYVMHQYMTHKDGTFGANYLSLGEMNIIISEMPKKVRDWESEDEKTKIRNPYRVQMKNWRNRIANILDMGYTYVTSPENVRVYYWFDY